MISLGKDRLFLVSGASSGIGLAVAELLNSLGASVVGIGRNLQKLENARANSRAPERFHIHCHDLLQENDFNDLLIRLRGKYGKFSGLCSCAGVMFMDTLRNYDEVEAAKIYKLHAQIPIMLAKALTDRRNCIGPGTSLVFVSALGAVVPQTGLLSYGAAKAALIAEAKCLSRELGKRKMRVNCVSPALVRTPMTEGDYNRLMGYDVLVAEEANYPLGIGEPADVANACVFLLSSASKWISGQNLVLDGGRY